MYFCFSILFCPFVLNQCGELVDIQLYFPIELGPTLPCLNLEENLLDLTINEAQTNSFNALTLIGWVVSNKMVYFKAIIKAILLNIWSNESKIQVTYLARNKFVVTFDNIKDKRKKWHLFAHGQ